MVSLCTPLLYIDLQVWEVWPSTRCCLCAFRTTIAASGIDHVTPRPGKTLLLLIGNRVAKARVCPKPKSPIRAGPHMAWESRSQPACLAETESKPVNNPPKASTQMCPRRAARPCRNDASDTTTQRNAAEPSPSAPDHRTCTLLSRLPRSHPHTSRQQPLSTSTRTNRSRRYIFGLGREPLPHSEADTAPRIDPSSLLNRRGRCFDYITSIA